MSFLSFQVSSTLEQEHNALQQLLTNFSDFDSLSSQLSEKVTSQLHDTQKALTSQRHAIQEQEKRNFEEYTREKKEILSNKAQVIEDIEKEREQLVADNVCADECERNLLHAFENGEMEQEKYDKERVALESERQRIKEETENLDIIEKENERMTEEDLTKLNEKRASQIEEVNAKKDVLNGAIKEWENLVNSVISNQNEDLNSAKSEVSSLNSNLRDLKADVENERTKIENEVRKTEEQIQQVAHVYSLSLNETD